MKSFIMLFLVAGMSSWMFVISEHLQYQRSAAVLLVKNTEKFYLLDALESAGKAWYISCQKTGILLPVKKKIESAGWVASLSLWKDAEYVYSDIEILTAAWSAKKVVTVASVNSTDRVDGSSEERALFI